MTCVVFMVVGVISASPVFVLMAVTSGAFVRVSSGQCISNDDEDSLLEEVSELIEDIVVFVESIADESLEVLGDPVTVGEVATIRQMVITTNSCSTEY